jgi:uncharacterized cupredoxin-like copper-binding protein
MTVLTRPAKRTTARQTQCGHRPPRAKEDVVIKVKKLATAKRNTGPSTIVRNHACVVAGRCLFAIAVATFPGAALADPGHQHSTAAVGKPAKATAANRTIAVTLGDNFFTPDSIDVKPGEVVRFVVKNTGAFLHEFNLGTPAMHAEHQKEMATMMDHGMLTLAGSDRPMAAAEHSQGGAGHAMTHDDPNSILVNPGETKELVWTFGKHADLEFACNIPGHYASGMVGKVLFRR